MENSNVSRKSLSRITLTLCAVSVLIGLLLSSQGTPTAAEATAAATESPATAQPIPIDAVALENWHLSLPKIHVPGPGCYTITYPSNQWQQVACVNVPPPRQMLALPPAPAPINGNVGTDSAQANGLFIQSATGSFQSVTNVAGEAGPYNNAMGPAVNDTYTLQLTTDSYMTSYCGGCTVQVQFIFGSQPGQPAPQPAQSVYILYFLTNSSVPCPAGWTTFAGPPIYTCYGTTGQAQVMNSEPISKLQYLGLFGSVIDDKVILYDNGLQGGMLQGSHPMPPAAGHGWTIAEFNVLGNGNAGQAMFTPMPATNITIVPRVQLAYVTGGITKPLCTVTNWSSESNNLGNGTTPPVAAPPPPAHAFILTTGGGPAACMDADDIGDTHLITFDGLKYDFQAEGDFILAKRGDDFVVQTRQVSGAPNWPNTAVNKAVAMQMGKTRVALCPTTTGLHIDDRPKRLDDGETFSLSDGVLISRKSNVYLITGPTGDSVRAVVNTYNGETWIDVFVGLGAWPAKVGGLLAGANGNANGLVTRDGAVLRRAFAFNDLYGGYAKSWAVHPGESLLTDCEERIKLAMPTQPFHAADLLQSKDQTIVKKAQAAQALCSKLGVKPGPFLDDCTLDVVVIGSDKAADVFVGLPAPVAVVGTVDGAVDQTK